MKQNWFKQNLNSIVLGCVLVITASVIVILLKRSSGKRADIESELASQRDRLRSLLTSNPLPTKKNIEIIRANYKNLQTQYDQLLEAANRKNITIPDLRPIEFSQLLAQKLAQLRETATYSQVTISDDFAFGFKRYVSILPARNLSGEEAKKTLKLLTKQLIIIERLSNTLIAAGVSELTAIRRVKVEPDEGGDDIFNASTVQDIHEVYRPIPFEIEFRCSTGALQNWLNSLISSEWFFVVRSLEIKTESSKISKTEIDLNSDGSDVHRLFVKVKVDLIEFEPSLKQVAS